ncbi:ABC transporter ATP-binding protein, partial [Streptomyces sp. NPDC002265]|uniref:ABC transporter ATP-binding protein n=1 Tax=Streptomyces sp. NPDC002265 TaxID=3154415 RepID=UPI00331C238D
RQRLTLARSLITDPEVLVLDEPTSAVDSHTEARIAEGVSRLRAGRTTVVFTSSPLLLDRADRVVLVHEGEVAAVGEHRELVLKEPRYRAVVTRETQDEPAFATGARTPSETAPAGPTAATVSAARPEPVTSAGAAGTTEPAGTAGTAGTDDDGAFRGALEEIEETA